MPHELPMGAQQIARRLACAAIPRAHAPLGHLDDERGFSGGVGGPRISGLPEVAHHGGGIQATHQHVNPGIVAGAVGVDDGAQ
jgi:hypothetical protein